MMDVALEVWGGDVAVGVGVSQLCLPTLMSAQGASQDPRRVRGQWSGDDVAWAVMPCHGL